MPKGIYLVGKLWCTRCQEKQDSTPGNFCPDCRSKMRIGPRTKAGKAKYKATLVSRNGRN